MDRLSDYDYELPVERIAQRPLADRAASRLLHLHRADGRIEHRSFRDALSILRPGDLLVLNDTRVTALRMLGKRPTGGRVEVLLLREQGERQFVAMAKPGRRLKTGTALEFDGLRATIAGELPDGLKLIEFDDGPDLTARLQRAGAVPLPPYIHESIPDGERYQTVYARHGGSSAAPTAGLHFTGELLESLAARGVRLAYVTLDVGIDTFRPVQSEDLGQHAMHGERCFVPDETARAIAEAAGRIVAVGTTAVRTLETMAIARRRVAAGAAESRLFVRPGYRFLVIDGMFTNFHLPRTTMLMMIAALAGREAVFRAYDEAVQQNYRFLSFGDAMLIL